MTMRLFMFEIVVFIVFVALACVVSLICYNNGFNKGYESAKVDTIREVWAENNCVVQLPSLDESDKEEEFNIDKYREYFK